MLAGILVAEQQGSREHLTERMAEYFDRRADKLAARQMMTLSQRHFRTAGRDLRSACR